MSNKSEATWHPNSGPVAPQIVYTSEVQADLIQHMGSDAMIANAARVSTGQLGEYDDAKDAGLIRYLMRKKHGSPFEHNSMTFLVEAPIFVAREYMRHRVGHCLPGDTQIPVGTWKNGKTKSIKKIHDDWKIGVPDTMGRVRKLPSTNNLVTRTVNFDTGFIEHARMVDVFESGVKKIIKITLSSGKTLRCTADHRVWSEEGWVRAGDIEVGAVLGRQGRIPVGERVGIPRRLREGIKFWTTEMRSDVIAPGIDTCYICKEVFPSERLEVDHVVPVSVDITKSLDIANLAPACEPCHQAKTNTEGAEYATRRRKLALGVRFEAVTSVVDDGEEMTYDIEMPAPWHNFIANDFVVHNSYNEVSGRYSVLEPKFYVPAEDRPLVNVGSSANPKFEAGDNQQVYLTCKVLESAYEESWMDYQTLIQTGIGNEVARMVLPLGIMTSFYVTCNARSLMAFLALRTSDAGVSNPQHEIELVAKKLEEQFAILFPKTYASFNEFGRVAP